MKFYTFNKNVCLELQWDKCSGFSQDLLISFFATNPHFIFEANIQFCFALENVKYVVGSMKVSFSSIFYFYSFTQTVAQNVVV